MRERGRARLVYWEDVVSYTAPVELQLTPEEEARLVEAVKRRIAPAWRGNFVEHDQALARIDRLLQP
jgi:hypothetical protein